MASEAAIVTRYLRLRKQVLEPSDTGITFEGLIDALLVLYEECSNTKTKNRSHQINSFISTFQNVVHNYTKLRVNIGDFKVERVIGRGNFADVQLAKEKSTGKVYALKVMKKIGENSTAFYCEERDIMARNCSPWLTKLDYAFQDSGHLYLAMEFHCGGDLLSLLDKNDNRLEEKSVQFYTAEVALGIHDLHKMGFVHRDIKPENILIDRTGHLKLADFGNAARLSRSGTVNKVMPVGTPDYIAPEVLQCLQSEEGSHGVECDYWSLGILSYEMFFGSSPFTDLEGSVINTYANIMRHSEKPVSFPGGNSASEHLRSFIGELLKPASTRLTHQKLVRHPFFATLDWNNMLNMAPPHVPQVSGEDDDSNFEHLEESVPGPDLTSLKPKKEFRNLPFVGFTFTSDKGKVKGLGKEDNVGLETELKNKVADLEKIKLRNFQLEQQILNHTKVTESSVRDFEQVEKITTQLNLAEQDNAELKSTVKNVERILEIERQDRAATEQRTISLLEDVRKKWSKAEEERMDAVRKELHAEKERAENYESKWRESQSQLKKFKGELEATVDVKNKLKSKLKDYKQRLENVATLDDLRSKAIQKLEAEKIEAKAEISLCKSQLDESRVNDGKVDTLQMLIEQRDQMLAEKDAEIKIKTNEVEAFASQQEENRKKLRKYEEKYSASKKELSRLKEELESAKNESRVEVESQLGVHAQLKSEVKDLLRENAEYKSSIKVHDSLKTDLETKISKLESDAKETVLELNKLKKDNDEELKEKEVMYKKKMENLEKVFDTLKSKIDMLEKKGKSESGSDLKKKQINQLECQVEKLEVEKAKIQNEKSEMDAENEKLRKTIVKADTEMISLKKDHEAELEKSIHEKSAFAIEMEDLAKLKVENEKLTNDLKEVKLDLRIEKRELEKKSSLVTYIREKETKNKEKIEQLEKDKGDLEKQMSDMKVTMEGLEKASENLKLKEDKLAESVAQLKKVKDEKSELMTENRRLKTDSSSQDTKLEKLNKNIVDLKEENSSIATLKVNNEALQEVSNELEKQVIDFERLNERLEAKIQLLQTEKRDFDSKLDREKEETRKSKIAVNEEKSSKIQLESQVKELRRHLEESENVRETEKDKSEKHLSEYKALCQKLSDTCEEVTKDNVSKEQFGILNQRAKSILEVENNQLKEELSEMITQLNSHKESNFKLTHGIEEAIKKIADKNTEMSNLKLAVEADKRTLDEQLMRHEATQAQQSKLIDFLQTKVSALEGRKKTFSDKIFGNKENNRPSSLSSVPLSFSEVESRLEKEKAKNRKLTQQLSRARAEVIALKTNQTDTMDIPADMLGQVDPKAHNIPHRLGQATNKKSTKCPVCQKSIGVMAICQVCRDCNLFVHAPCSSSLPPTCGLPSQMLAALSDVPSITQRPLPPAPKDTNHVKESPVQTLVGGVWRDAHMSLTQSHMLDLCTDNTKRTRLDQVGLILPHCKVSVQSSVGYNEVYHLNTTDRPYTFKLTTQTTGQAEKILYLMCQNFAGKVDWVNKLDEVIRSSTHNHSSPQHSLPEGTTRRLVCSLPLPQEVLAATMAKDKIVIGSTQGLAVLTSDGVAHCQGISSPVHKVHYLSSLNLLVLATGGDGLPSQLVIVSSLSLTAPLQPRAVTNELSRCHTFSCLEASNNTVYLCAASEDLVVILEWSARRESFVLRNKFSTDQPTAAIHFTDHSVLVGTNKFYEIDLRNYTAEEFLDMAHPGVKDTVSSSTFSGSLPRNVLVLRHGDQEIEYLLTYTRTILFVDSFGQQTRPPLIQDRIPLEHRLLRGILVTSFCDMLEFRDLETGEEPVYLSATSPHLLSLVGEELLYSHQDTASNNLGGIRFTDPDL